jgi:DNA polymerase-3 subunit gamma/tau
MLAFRPSAPVPVRSAAPAAEPVQKPAAPAADSAAAPAPEKPEVSGVQESAAVSDQWDQVVPALGLKAAAQALASNCAFESRDGGVVHLRLNRRHEQIASDSAKQRMEQALCQYYGETVSIKITIVGDEVESPAVRQQQAAESRHQEAVQSLQEDQVVKGLQDAFDAEVRPDMVMPIDETS